MSEELNKQDIVQNEMETVSREEKILSFSDDEKQMISSILGNINNCKLSLYEKEKELEDHEKSFRQLLIFCAISKKIDINSVLFDLNSMSFVPR